jgi:hypothetical protein
MLGFQVGLSSWAGHIIPFQLIGPVPRASCQFFAPKKKERMKKRRRVFFLKKKVKEAKSDVCDLIPARPIC